HDNFGPASVGAQARAIGQIQRGKLSTLEIEVGQKSFTNNLSALESGERTGRREGAHFVSGGVEVHFDGFDRLAGWRLQTVDQIAITLGHRQAFNKQKRFPRKL